MKEFEWSQTLDLIHPSDRRRVIHIRYARNLIALSRVYQKNNSIVVFVEFPDKRLRSPECKESTSTVIGTLSI